MRAALLALIIALGLSNPAGAQSEPAPEQLRAEAARLIAEANAGDFFVPEPSAPAVAARHVASGLLCRLGARDRPGDIRIVASESQDIHRGDDVSCTLHAGASVVTLYASRYPETQSLEAAFQGAVGALRQVHTTAELIDPSTLQWVTLGDRPPPPPSATAAFRINVNGHDAFTRVPVYVANGWVYKLRFTSPTPEENYIADFFWIMALTELAPPALARP